ncbi:RNA polymerase [Acidihalobacter yilgarnensis]|uniref:RNA polymerase n=1 Tax=Acidihalobacter yilgarnensis TaxID=2819280 RepID=A0A1D8INA1_9GAMM|nr:RNA polymerase sigma factor [Acidihalobacter yilgarnensis]AOU97946.1 RNA polymerase [Acidihalobacter yilgarnensis]
MRHDSFLLESAIMGDQKAVEKLLISCRPDLQRIAKSQCASGVDPDDAVQESMMQIYSRLGALRTLTSFPAWVFAIVRRECSRLLRSMRGLTVLPDPDNIAFIYIENPGLQYDLISAIQSLPGKYRVVIILRDFEEYSISEIADKLFLTREAVKSRIHRGRQMIQEYFDD